MANLPWEIKPQLHTVTDASGAASIEVPDYGSLLVCEVQFLSALPDELADDALTNTFVPYCLRKRFDLADEVSDEEILEKMPIGLRTALFLFFIYGKEGRPKEATPTKAKKPRSRSTGPTPSGDSKSTIQAIPTSPVMPTETPQSGSSALLLGPTKMSA